jgi:hypothetical protein
MVAGQKLLYGRCPGPGNRRAVGLKSLRPMPLAVGLRVTAAAMIGVIGFGAWWWMARPAGAVSALGSVGYLAWLLWTALGVAVVGTLASEREPRAAWIVAGVFGGGAALAGALGGVP